MAILHKRPVLIVSVLSAAFALAPRAATAQAIVELKQEAKQHEHDRPLVRDEVPVERRDQGRKAPNSNVRISPQPETDGSTSLIAFIETPYSGLNFRRDKDGYVARMEVEVVLDDPKDPDSVLKGRWSEEIRLATYEETQGKAKTRHVLSIRRIIKVPPAAETSVSFSIKDQESGAAFEVKDRKLRIPQYAADRIGLSKPLPVLQHNPQTQETTPHLSRTYILQRGDQKDLTYYLRLSNPVGADSAELRTRITNPQDNNKVLWSENKTVKLGPGVNEFVNTHAKALTGEAMSKSGEYNLEVMVVPSAAGQPVQGGLVSEKLMVHYLGLPPDFKPEEVLEQLKYLEQYPNNFLTDPKLAKETAEELKRVRKIGMVKCGPFGLKKCLTKDPKELEKRQAAISELVNKLPPLLRDIYFQRVQLANRYFGEHGPTPGWRTERGMVLIVLGAPDDRRSNPQANMFGDPNWEIWLYWEHPVSHTQSWQVGFWDRWGNGDFRLMEGISEPALCQYFGQQVCESARNWWKGTY